MCRLDVVVWDVVVWDVVVWMWLFGCGCLAFDN